MEGKPYLKIKNIQIVDTHNLNVFLLYVLTQANEKYMGDALLQKTYTVDFLTKKKVINKGLVPQYYVEDSHDAIIPKELFYRVQEEKARRASIYHPGAKKKDEPVKGKYSSKYVLSDIIICGECGQPYRRQVWSKYGVKKHVWRCDSRLKHGAKKCRNSPTLAENTLHEAVMEAINSMVEDQGEFVQSFRENVIRIIGSYSAEGKATEFDEQFDDLQRELMMLIEESARLGHADKEFDRRYREIADQIKTLKKKKARRIREIQLAESYEQRMQDVDGYMKKTGSLKRQFDDDIVRRLIQSIRVINEGKIEVQFRSGIVMRQGIMVDE